jgi:hypothetical protein
MPLDLPPLQPLERFKRHTHAYLGQGKCVIPFAQRRVVLFQNPQQVAQLVPTQQLHLSIGHDLRPLDPRRRVEAGDIYKHANSWEAAVMYPNFVLIKDKFGN